MITLLLLAPFIAEVLSGATRVSYLFVFIPEVMTWGCGALLIREFTRRWRGGWPTLVLLGLALAVAEEFIIQQTSLAPLVGLAPERAYGRYAGVNWVWLLSMLGFETVWVVVVPVTLTEVLFPGCRAEPWLGRKGIARASRLFVVGALIAWYGWTQRARPQLYHMPPYDPPVVALVGGAAALGELIVLAYRFRALQSGATSRQRNAPSPWWVGAVAYAMARPWLYLTPIAYGARPTIPVGAVVAGALVWAAMTILVFAQWRRAGDWCDRHRFAAVAGAIVAVMTSGFGGQWLPVDLVGRLVFEAAAVVALARIGVIISRRT